MVHSITISLIIPLTVWVFCSPSSSVLSLISLSLLEIMMTCVGVRKKNVWKRVSYKWDKSLEQKRNCICIRPSTIGLTVVHHKQMRWNCHRLWNGQGTQVFEQMSVRALTGIRGDLLKNTRTNSSSTFLDLLDYRDDTCSILGQPKIQTIVCTVHSKLQDTYKFKQMSVGALSSNGEASPDSHEIKL